MLAASVLTALATAPSASADGADAVIAELKAQGYTVALNWPSGYDTVPLWACTVTNVHNPDSSPQPPAATTLYVDVYCPNHQDD